MASEVTIPRLGWNMDEGTFVGWLKRDGQTVSAGEPLFSLEGDKATQDIESLETGILRIPPDGPRDGDKVVVGALVGYLVAPGEPAPFEADRARIAVNSHVESPRDGEAPAEPRQAGSFNNHVETAQESEAPADPGLPVARHEGGAHGHKLRISPRARRAAGAMGVDAATLQGSGRNGRIVERDIRAAAPRPQSGPPSLAHAVAVSPIRRTIAERMVRSAQTTAAVTLSTTIDATNLVNLRHQFKTAAGPGEAPAIAYTDIVAKLTAVALGNHPLLNARWGGDKVLVSPSINIGIAVDTDLGLLVPVIRDVPSLSLRQLAARSRDLIDRARRGALGAADMQGGTFTVTNLGAMDIEMFTPLINLPECAILGLGRIQQQVVVVDKQFVARDRMYLSLTFDHRIVDGAPAARFLQALSRLIENPSPWLMS